MVYEWKEYANTCGHNLGSADSWESWMQTKADFTLLHWRLEELSTEQWTLSMHRATGFEFLGSSYRPQHTDQSILKTCFQAESFRKDLKIPCPFYFTPFYCWEEKMMLCLFHGKFPAKELCKSSIVASRAAGTSQCPKDLIHHRTISSVHAFRWDQASSNPSSAHHPKNHCSWRALSGKILSGLIWSVAFQNNNTKAVQTLYVSFGMGRLWRPS